jgi:hypothetical protein
MNMQPAGHKPSRTLSISYPFQTQKKQTPKKRQVRRYAMEKASGIIVIVIEVEITLRPPL